MSGAYHLLPVVRLNKILLNLCQDFSPVILFSNQYVWRRLRCNLSRSQNTVTVQKFNYMLMRALPNIAKRSWVSGCNNHYKFVLSAGAKQKP
jgi:hypothetical protein